MKRAARPTYRPAYADRRDRTRWRDLVAGALLAAIVVAGVAIAVVLHPESLVTPLPWPSAAP
jgi:hypothetical protein